MGSAEVLVLALLFALIAAGTAPTRVTGECKPVPVMEQGRLADTTCADRPRAGITIVDLRDAWTPKILSDAPS